MFDYKKFYEKLLQKYKQQELKINRLRIQLAEFIKDPIPPVPTVQEVMDDEVHRGSSSEQKLQLFREFFHGRRDVFAVRWENEKTGKSGYSPSCENDFDRSVCHKPKVKCSECLHQKFHPLGKEFLRKHLQGKMTIGIFPMLLDETCIFLAIDLDKSGWLEDAKAIRNTCLELGILPAIERSDCPSLSREI